MLAVTLRAADAYTRAAPPSSKPVTTTQRKRGPFGDVAGFAALFAVVALVILLRVSTYTATHGYQPMFAPILALFR
jgi:hypothetical protein